MFKATKLMVKHSNNSFKKKIKMERFDDDETKENQSSKAVNYTACATNSEDLGSSDNPEQLLKKFSLRGNQLNGSVLIGNYNYLTHLEVIENEMEILDLSSLAQLDSLTCTNNKLMELMINCNNLTSLVADNNCLRQINITSVPCKLQQVNISNNCFTELPKWLKDCTKLEYLDASHNHLRKITNFVLCSQTSSLKTLSVSHNYLRVIEKLSSCFSSLQILHLHCNELQLLPDNLFIITRGSLKELNLSSNKLQILPAAEAPMGTKYHTSHRTLKESENMCLEILKLSSNKFDDRVYEVLQAAKHLKLLHAAYNKISTIPEKFLQSCIALQDLMFSGNQLQKLPSDLCKLKKLKILRVHSNLLLTVPPLNTMDMLRILDLAHNHLDRLDLLSILPKSLKYLDLSCNSQLKLDETQVKMCRSKKNLHLVDVSDKNRSTLPTACHRSHELDQLVQRPPWLVGFSETTGNCGKLLVIQLRESKFRPEEALFGMFASEEVFPASSTKFSNIVPTLLQQCRTFKENIGNFIKYVLLDTQKKLPDLPVLGANLCYISRESGQHKDMVRSKKLKRYVLRVIGFGNIGVYLIRKTANIQLLVPHELPKETSKQPKNNLPDLLESEWILNNEDEYLVVCNSGIWSILDVDRIAREIRKEEDVVLAAKRVQDMTQSFGGENNLSVIIVRFKNIGTDVDQLIKELKETVGRKPHPITTSHKYLCCDHTISCCQHLGSLRHSTGLSTRSDRSSPSGQSDLALSVSTYKPELELILAHDDVVEEAAEIEEIDETESALSEEQFKCWEYMLEQNTQLLFDKELDTISKSYTKNSNLQRKIHKNSERFDCLKSNLLKGDKQRFISASSPQLMYSDIKKPALMFDRSAHNYNDQSSFLSKHFGSARSFGMSYGLFGMNSKSRDSLSHYNYSKLTGGPNAAYFGSLQRLMPLPQGHDFNLTTENTIINEDKEDFSEHENRMRKYWGVATTEL